MHSNHDRLGKDMSPEEKRALLTKLLTVKAQKATAKHPMSHGQRALWFLYQNAPDSTAYNAAFAVRICSKIDRAAWRKALQGLMNRHEALRARFPMENGEPVQVIPGYCDVPLEEIDAAAWDRDRLQKEVVQAYNQPMDLEQGPIFKTYLYSQGEGEHVFLLVVHHIVFDAWSLWLCLEELRELYEAAVNGRAPELSPIDFSYSDYIKFQNENLDNAAGAKALAFWQKELQDAAPPLSIIPDKRRPVTQTFRGASIDFNFSSQLAEKLKDLAQAEGATLYMVLLAALHVLLHRYSGQDKIAVGTPTAGRNDGQFAKTVGYFVNPITIQGDMSGNPAFRDYLQCVRRTLLDCMAHQDYPFPLLVQALNPKRDAARSPFFQIEFVLQRPPQSGIADLIAPGEGARIRWAGLELASFDMGQQEGQFELTLDIVEAKGSLFGTFKYNVDLFVPETIERLIHHFLILLESIVFDPSMPVDQLPIMDAEDNTKLLKYWNDTATDYPRDVLLCDLVQAQVDATPTATALVYEDKQMSYAELDQAANQLANFMIARGIVPGAYIGVCMERSLEMVISLHGIVKAGGAYVPLDPAHPDDRLSFMVKDSGVVTVLTQAALADRFPKGYAKLICVDTEWNEITQASGDRPDINLTPADPAYMIYTSGSTGLPKGVPNSHGGICNRLLWMQDAYRLNETDSVLQKTPFGFDVSVWEFFWPLMTGARLVVAKPGGHKDSRYLVKTINRHKITTLHFVPPMLQMFLEDDAAGTCRSLRRVICSGEALSCEVTERFFAQLEAELHNLYGPTEAAIDVTFWKCIPNQEGRVPIGKPIANTQIYILDRFQRPTPIGVPGELYIGGANVAIGYHNRPELTAKKFITDPFANEAGARLFKTGDLARFLPDGNVEFLGRIDNQVKLRGFRIELGEIEETLRHTPAVAEALVILREDRPGDKRLAAYVVADNGVQISEEQLKTYLRTKLPDYMVPTNIVFLSALPLTANGKVNRQELPTPAMVSSQVRVPPRNATEKQLTELWQEVLGVENVGIHDDFFDLGGHSLLAVRLMAEIEKWMGQRLPLSAVIQGATPAKLAKTLDMEQSQAAWQALVKMRDGKTDDAPLFFVPGAGGNVVYLHDLAGQLGSRQTFYGIQALGLDGQTPPLTRVEDMADHNLQTIIEKQPQGPYYLAGHCFGGLIAFETAKQMERAGHAVAGLALLDIPAPRAADQKEREHWDWGRWLLSFAEMVSQGAGQPLELTPDALAQLDSDQQTAALHDAMVTAAILPPQTSVQQVQGMLSVFIANGKAQYHPKQGQLAAPVLLLRAEKVHPDYDFMSYDDKNGTLGWQPYFKKTVRVEYTPGDHNTMMVASNAAQTGACLRRYLDELKVSGKNKVPDLACLAN